MSQLILPSDRGEAKGMEEVESDREGFDRLPGTGASATFEATS